MRRVVLGPRSSLVRSGGQDPTKLRDPFAPSGKKGCVGGSGNRLSQDHQHHRMGPPSHARGDDDRSCKGAAIVINQQYRRSIRCCFGLPRQRRVVQRCRWCAWNVFNVGGAIGLGGSSLLAGTTAYVPEVRGQTRTSGRVQHTPTYRHVNTTTGINFGSSEP